MPSQWKEGLPLKTANVIAYLLFLGSNIYALIPPQSVYENIKQTYLTPANWAFFVWPIIHILLLGTVIYQFASARGKIVVVDGISWGFTLIATLSAIFVTVRVNHHYTLAFVLSLFIVYISFKIGRIIEKEHFSKSAGDRFFVHLPFFLWYGWAIVLSFLTVFEAFGVDATKHEDGGGTQFCVFLILLLSQLGAVASLFSRATSDNIVTFVISWTLWAIYDHQRSSAFIHRSATFFSLLSLVWVFAALDKIYCKLSGRSGFMVDGEREPLLGH